MSDLNSTTAALSKAEAKIEQLKGTFPIPTKDIVATKNEILGLKDGITAIKELLTELFPDGQE
jgi:hypothetical protein